MGNHGVEEPVACEVEEWRSRGPQWVRSGGVERETNSTVDAPHGILPQVPVHGAQF